MGIVFRFALLAGVVASVLFVAQRHQVLQNAGLVGHCSRIATPAGKSGFWHECVAGKVTGTPSMSLTSCVRVSHTPERDVWRCPTEVGTNKTRQ